MGFDSFHSIALLDQIKERSQLFFQVVKPSRNHFPVSTSLPPESLLSMLVSVHFHFVSFHSYHHVAVLHSFDNLSGVFDQRQAGLDDRTTLWPWRESTKEWKPRAKENPGGLNHQVVSTSRYGAPWSSVASARRTYSQVDFLLCSDSLATKSVTKGNRYIIWITLLCPI